MTGGIDLREFIRGVKSELVSASVDGAKDPRFELSEMELEAEFSLEATVGVEGGFKFLVKVAGETTGTQTHRVRLLFRPIRTHSPRGHNNPGPGGPRFGVQIQGDAINNPDGPAPSELGGSSQSADLAEASVGNWPLFNEASATDEDLEVFEKMLKAGRMRGGQSA